MTLTKTDLSKILRITAHRRMGDELHVKEDKPLKRKRAYRDNQSQRELYHNSVLNTVGNVLEQALFQYDDHQSVEKHILELFSEYDDRGYRDRIEALQNSIRILEDRINSGKDHPTMRMILRKILGSKKRELNKTLGGSPAGTPASSDDEQEDDFRTVLERPSLPTGTPPTTDDEEDILCEQPATHFAELQPQNLLLPAQNGCIQIFLKLLMTRMRYRSCANSHHFQQVLHKHQIVKRRKVLIRVCQHLSHQS